VAHQYGEYIEACMKMDAQILVPTVAVSAFLKPETAKKLGQKFKQSVLNAKVELDMIDQGELIKERILYGNSS
jgi:hypothetical protein